MQALREIVLAPLPAQAAGGREHAHDGSPSGGRQRGPVSSARPGGACGSVGRRCSGALAHELDDPGERSRASIAERRAVGSVPHHTFGHVGGDAEDHGPFLGAYPAVGGPIDAKAFVEAAGPPKDTRAGGTPRRRHPPQPRRLVRAQVVKGSCEAPILRRPSMLVEARHTAPPERLPRVRVRGGGQPLHATGEHHRRGLRAGGGRPDTGPLHHGCKCVGMRNRRPRSRREGRLS